MNIQFDAVSLDARLMSISISSKRVKDGNTETEYSFNFEKDADKDDFDMIIPYFKVKEPDEFKRKKKRPFIYYDTYFTIE